MKKIFVILLSIIILSGLTIAIIYVYKEIFANKFDINEYLIKVMNSEVTFIDEKSSEVLFKDYVFYNKPYEKLVKYSFGDLDSDGIEELVAYVETNPAVDAYMIFRYNKEEHKVYGYMFGIREFGGLRKDGTYFGSGGADVQGYYKIHFDNNVKIETEIAYSNNIFSEYRINNQNVSKEEITNFVKEWNEREKCIWETERIKKTQ